MEIAQILMLVWFVSFIALFIVAFKDTLMLSLGVVLLLFVAPFILREASQTDCIMLLERRIVSLEEAHLEGIVDPSKPVLVVLPSDIDSDQD